MPDNSRLIYIFSLVTDCLLSEWGPWSECDAKCGTGTRSRTRTILKAPENGGKHCASLTQKQGCEGYRCKNFHERKALSGKLKLLRFLAEQSTCDKLKHLLSVMSQFGNENKRKLNSWQNKLLEFQTFFCFSLIDWVFTSLIR